MTVDISQAKLSSLIPVSQFAMINTKQMKDRRIQIMHMHGVFCPMMLFRFNHIPISVRKVVPILIRLTVGYPLFHSTPRYPSSECPSMMNPPIIFAG